MSPISESIAAGFSLLDRAAERCINIWVSGAEPVSERRPEQLAGGGHRSALHHDVLTVEEICRVLRIRRHGVEAGKRAKNGARPFPSVADQVFDAPGACTLRMTAGTLWIPGREVEDAARGVGLRVAPRVHAFAV